MAGTYPPPNQILSALGIEVAWRAEDTLVGRSLADVSLLAGPEAPPSMGHLVAVLDLVAGSRASAAAEGDWLATSDVWANECAPIGEGPIELTTELLRAGKRSTVVVVEVIAGGRPVVTSTVEFSRIRREATAHSTRSAAPSGEWMRLGSGPLLDQPLEQACGFETVDPGAGIVELRRSPFVNNSIGTLQGGVVALLADVAARALVGPGSRTTDLNFRFLAQTGDGPARTSATVIRSDADTAIVRVEVVDVANDALVGLAVCGVRPAG